MPGSSMRESNQSFSSSSSSDTRESSDQRDSGSVGAVDEYGRQRNRIFCGGLAHDLKQEDFRNYFERYAL